MEDLIKRDFTPLEINLLVGILNVPNEDYMNITNVANKIGTSWNNPIFNRIFKYLKDNKIVNVFSTVGNSKLVQIKHNKLRDLLDEQEYINYIVDKYLKKEHFFHW